MLEQFIVNYGYLAVFVGALVEGEVALVIAGFSAFLGYLNFPLVVIIGFVGTLLSDQVYFYIGRKKGRQFIENRVELRRKSLWVYKIIEKYHNWVLLLFRFAYGFRVIVPFALGASSVSLKRFTIFNTVGAAIWALLFTGGGYFFGTAFEVFFGRVKSYEMQAVGVIVIIAVVLWIIVAVRKNRILKMIKLDDMII